MKDRKLRLLLAWAVLLALVFAMGASAEGLALQPMDFVEYSGEAVREVLTALAGDMREVRTAAGEDVLLYRFSDRLDGQLVGGFCAYMPSVPRATVDETVRDMRLSADWFAFDMYSFQSAGLAKYTDTQPFDAEALNRFMDDYWHSFKGLDFADGRIDIDGVTWYWEPVYYEDADGGIHGDEIYLYIYSVARGRDEELLEEMKVFDPVPAEYHTQSFLITNPDKVIGLFNAMSQEQDLRTAAANASEYRNLARGSSGKDVRAVQKRLSDLGFLTSSVDGQYGPMTEEAVKAYQEAQGLEPTGEADPAMQVLLLSETDERDLLTQWIDRNS